MPEPTLGFPQANPTVEQAVADVLFSWFVSRADECEPGIAQRVYEHETDAGACDWLLVKSPLYAEETHATVGALRLLDPGRFGRFQLAKPITP